MGVNKQRLTITIAPVLVDAGQQAVEAGEASSLSSWVSAAIEDRIAKDRKMALLSEAIAEFESEHGEITDEEIASQRRTDRAKATVVRGKKSA